MGSESVDIILRTYNHLGRTIDAVNSLYNYTDNFNLTVIDNSTDLTEEYFKRLQKGVNNLTYIRPDPEVKCFNEFLNIGLRNTKSEFVVGMANTIVVEPDWLRPLVGLMSTDPKIAIIQPKHLMPIGNIENAGMYFQEPMMCPLNHGMGDAGHRYTHIREVAGAGFCLFMMRREAVYPFEEGHYLGWYGLDDVDACFKLKEQGWKIMYCGYSSAYHYAYSTRGSPHAWSEETWGKYNENRFRFLTRWANWGEFKKEEE